MCSKEVGLPVSVAGGYGAGGAGLPPGPGLEQYRLQLYQYAVAAQRLYPLGPYYPPRILLPRPEEPKPQHSYIGLIAMAILSSPEYKLVLSDIYQYILDHYPYFRSRGPGWRNSIRHNLSLNDCFVKAGRSANGKGHYWAIHPANVEDFKKGDFRRRKAQRKVRKHMGLAVEDDGTDSPSPPPPSSSASPPLPHSPLPLSLPLPLPLTLSLSRRPPSPSASASPWPGFPRVPAPRPSKRRMFDVDSLLAPDPDRAPTPQEEEPIDVVSGSSCEGGRVPWPRLALAPSYYGPHPHPPPPPPKPEPC